MCNDHIPRSDAQFYARQNNFVTYVNGRLPDLGPVAGMVGAEIWVKVGAQPPTAPVPSWPAQKTQSCEERTIIGCPPFVQV